MLAGFMKQESESMELRVERKLDESTESVIKTIIGAAIEVHKELGPGFLEKVYEQAMSLELTHRGLSYTRQVSVDVYYKNVIVHGQVLDMIVEGKVILELKSVAELLPIHEAQIISYVKSTKISAGLLINFKERLVKDGIKRFIWC